MELTNWRTAHLAQAAALWNTCMCTRHRVIRVLTLGLVSGHKDCPNYV